MGGYIVFAVEGRGSNGLMKVPAHMQGHPSAWSTYFAVDDCDVAAETAEENGAKLFMAPEDMEGVRRLAVIQDPQGAAFSILAVEGRPPELWEQ